MAEIDFATLISPVARRLWGEPNAALSNTQNLRWGSHGSKSVDPGKGTWFDHETNVGGGTLDLVKRETGHADKDAVVWLEREGFINGHATAGGFGRIVATYDYVDEAGKLLFQVVRLTPKDFRQRRPNGTGKWLWNLKDTRRVLYQLPQLFEAIANDRPVLIVEGEKDCDNLRKLDITATTNPGGANKWRSEYNEYLRGANVILVPDNDDPGRTHMQAVAAELSGVAKSIRVLELPELADKGDVTDWIKNGGTAEKLWELIEQTPQWNAPPTNDLDEFTFDGTETIAPPPMLIEELLPAAGIAIVGGQSGAGKTFLVILLGACLASAKPFFGKDAPMPVGVLYVAAEGQGMIAARFTVAKDALGLDIKQPLPIAWLKSPPKLNTPQEIDRFISRLRALDGKFQQDHDTRLGVVILDTVAATFDLKDENDNAEAAKACARMRQIADGFGGVVVPVHHYGKSMESGLRGASA
jgi:AAA domain